ncbi:Non-reducing end beta-L-arabinofuranosidase [compost metagenome]
MKINPAEEAEFGIALRIPSWSLGMEISVNGEALNTAENIEQGYLVIRRMWRAGDIIEVNDPMEAHRIYAHPNLRADAQKVTIQRGPLVYCLESIDNGEPLSSISLKEDGELTAAFDETFLGGAVVVEADGLRVDQESWSGGLYSREKAPLQSVKVKAVPYYLWGNRGSGEMKVWIPEGSM